MLKNLSIRTCLTLMIVFFGVVLLFGAAAGLLSLRSSNASLQQMYTVDTPAVADLEGSAGQLLRLRLALATYASLVDLNDQDGATAVLWWPQRALIHFYTDPAHFRSRTDFRIPPFNFVIQTPVAFSSHAPVTAVRY
ncbi:MAG: Tar ligand binding domain-containing protein, partial [Paraburkholderia fungorum]|nr:Tar ligand binding domain-containing protein [Paraburkholderia fungorum]